MLAHLWLLPKFKTFSPSRFRYWGSNGFDYVCDTTEPTLHWTKEQMQQCSFCCVWHLKQCWRIERTVTWGTWGTGGIGWNWNVLSLGQISAILMDTHQSPAICFLAHLHLEIGCFCSEDIAVQGAPGRTAEWCTTSHQQLELDGTPTSLSAGKWCTRLKSALRILSNQSFQEKLPNQTVHKKYLLESNNSSKEKLCRCFHCFLGS